METQPLTFVIDALSIDVDLLVEKFEESGREELKVLDVGLLGGSRGLRGFGFRHPQGLAEISVDRVIGFALALRRLNPVPKE